jgi:hypothetical protein
MFKNLFDVWHFSHIYSIFILLDNFYYINLFDEFISLISKINFVKFLYFKKMKYFINIENAFDEFYNLSLKMFIIF